MLFYILRFIQMHYLFLTLSITKQHNVATKTLKDGRQIEIETPLLANIAPLIGGGIGFAFAKFTDADAMKTITYMVVGTALGFIPKIALDKQATDLAMSESPAPKKQTEQYAESEVVKSESPNDKSSDSGNESDIATGTYDAVDIVIDTDDIMRMLDSIAQSNGTTLVFNTKRNHFVDVINSLTQDEIDCLHDMLSIILEMPIDNQPSLEQTQHMLNEIHLLTDDYGMDVFHFVNTKLNEINSVIQQPELLEEKTNAI